MTETLANGYLSESTLQDLSNEYQHDRIKMIFKIFCFFVHLTKATLTSEGNAEATFVLSTRKQRFLKNIKTLSCWYSLESPR